MELSAAHAGMAGLVLLLISGAAYMGILRAEQASPRGALLKDAWVRIPVGASVITAFAVLGQPDDTSDSYERIPGCERTECKGPPAVCTIVYTCVREHRWYQWSADQTGSVYTLCTDASGMIRQKSEGMAFNLRDW